MKKWIKDHKKEILIAVGAVSVTSLYFMTIGKSKDKRNFSLSLNLRSDCSGGNPFYLNGDSAYASISINHPNFSLSDFGKFSEIIKKKIPGITDDVKISHIDVTYSDSINKIDF